MDDFVKESEGVEEIDESEIIEAVKANKVEEGVEKITEIAEEGKVATKNYVESYSSSESDDPSDRSFEFNIDKEAGVDATDAAGWTADPSLSPGWQLRPVGQAMHYRSPQLQVFTSRLSVLQHCIRVKNNKMLN